MPKRSTHERRSRRAKLRSAFAAVKAQQAPTLSRREIVAQNLIRWAGSTSFFWLHVAWFAAWIVLNAGVVLGAWAFDPFPFGLLTMVVSLEAIFLSIFVLMSQRRESRIAELREELTLQIDLRMEEEVTKTLHLVSGLYSRLNLPMAEDEDLEEMLQPLDLAAIEHEITEQIETAEKEMSLLKGARKDAPEGGGRSR